MDQAKELVRVLGNGAVVLLHGHGEVVVGPSVPTVVSRCIELELNARILQNILAKPVYLRPAATLASREVGAPATVVIGTRGSRKRSESWGNSYSRVSLRRRSVDHLRRVSFRVSSRREKPKTDANRRKRTKESAGAKLLVPHEHSNFSEIRVKNTEIETATVLVTSDGTLAIQ